MGKAVRAIIIEGDKLLVMHRNKSGSQYYTLVGGRVHDNETLEQALVREVLEETGMTVTAARQVFFEEHPEPYNQQYIFLCNVAPHADIAIQDASEEGFLNKLQTNIHTPLWAELKAFSQLSFRTPQLQAAILKALQHGFPAQPLKV